MGFQNSGKDFIVYPDRNLRFTYGEFNKRVDDLAKGLLFIGVKPGEKAWYLG